MTTIKINKATPKDVYILQTIGQQTFYETFASSNSKANMQKYMAKRFSIAQLTSELNDKNSEFYLATHNNNAIGYLKLNSGTSQTELQDTNALEIERIYVLHEFHGKQVGQLLYDKAFQLAKQKNADYIWLGVWENNHRALQFYKKNGFVVFDTHIFKLGHDKQTDLMMKRIINDKNNNG